MKHLIREINSCKQDSKFFSGRQLAMGGERGHRQCRQKNLLRKDQSGPEMKTLRDLLQYPPLSDLGAKVNIELNAGLYPLLDMQQLSTNTSTQLWSPKDDTAVSVLAEVCSVYDDGERSSPEALIVAGTLALWRGPCPSYPGCATVSPWRLSALDVSSRLIVNRISQEHPIVSWDSKVAQPPVIPLSVGQVVKLYPNHASSVAATFYNFYFGVNSEQDSDAAKIFGSHFYLISPFLKSSNTS